MLPFLSTFNARRLAALAIAVIAGCTDEPPLTDATTLSCPTPGPLPFRLESDGFQKSSNKTLATNDPRIKDEASDTLGNPGGAVADIYLPDDAVAANGAVRYRGAKARTTSGGGLFSNPLPGEHVSLWWYDAADTKWTPVGRTTTGDDGYYELADSGFEPPNLEPVYAMLEADDTCATHHDLMLPTGAKFVVTDIDGTLTTDDGQLLMEISDESYVPAMMKAADALMQTWARKRYPIVYLTARPHVLRAETRAWLDALGFPPGPVITTNGTTAGADAYKTIWLERMIASFGWVPVAAYGNASTDITAYANAGVAVDRTFIIGGLGGGSTGTIAIPNDDYTDHITSFVEQQPDN